MANTPWFAKRRITIIAVAIILLAGIYVLLPAKDHFGYKAPVAQQLVTQVTYKGINGENALQILEATHNVGVKHYSFGDLVQSIDGNTPDSSHTWSFYVNGKLADVGAGDYQTKSTDTLMWQVDAIQ